MSSNQKGVVKIKNKDYKLIVQRVNEFRQAHPEFGVETEVLHHDEIRVVAQVRIFDEQGRIRGSGVAEEFREASRINQTSAMENCETSAFGRALASMGYGGDVAYASAEEVVNAMNTEATNDALKHNHAVRENLEEIYNIKVAMQNEDWDTAACYVMDFDDDTAGALWVATTKGGIWTTKERDELMPHGNVGKAVSRITKEKAA
jgi:hypothetical protein|tara:strand:+ start:120 stop:731 length:612 start_codon:yes stop_codon:yes gene_type:complete